MNLEDHCSRKLYQGFYAHLRLGKEESSRHSSTATFGNASTDLDLDEPMVYDACSFYAHNEYELGSWRPARNKFGKAFNKSYHRHFHIAEPIEDYDDRVGLYSVYLTSLATG